MKTALLIGGPFDMHTTPVTDELPPYWRLPYGAADTPLAAPLNDVLNSRPIQQPWLIATYERQNMHWPEGVQTSAVVYTFREVQK